MKSETITSTAGDIRKIAATDPRFANAADQVTCLADDEAVFVRAKPEAADELRKRLDAEAEKRETALLENPAEFLKVAQRGLDAAREHYETELKKCSEILSLPTTDVLDVFLKHTDHGRAAYNRMDAAQRIYANGPIDIVEKRYAKQADALYAEIEADVEKFAVEKNLKPVDARSRLMEVSKVFAGKVKQHRKLHDEKIHAIEKARVDHQAALKASFKAIEKAEADAAAARARAKLTPAERKMTEHVESLAKSRGETYGKALAWATKNDPVVRALYAVADEERRAR